MTKEETDLAIHYWELRKKWQVTIRQKKKASYSDWQKGRAHSRRLSDYHERQTQGRGGPDEKTNHVCCECRKSFKALSTRYNGDNFPKCPNCGSEKFYSVGIMARVPRKNASNAVWKKFEFLFVDNKGYHTRAEQDKFRKEKQQEAIDKPK